MHTSFPRRRLSVALTAVLLAVLAAGPVSAHAELDTASPGPGEAVQGSAGELVATFTEPLDPDVTSLTVVDAAGTEVAAGGEPGSTPEQWRLVLPRLAPGEYEVRWAARSTVDDHLERGTYAFTVLAAATPSPTPSLVESPTSQPTASAEASTAPPTASPTSTPGPAPTPPADPAAGASVLLPIIALIVLVAGLGAWLFRRRAG